jgi:hypothetical protein
MFCRIQISVSCQRLFAAFGAGFLAGGFAACWCGLAAGAGADAFLAGANLPAAGFTGAFATTFTGAFAGAFAGALAAGRAGALTGGF